MIGTRWVWVTRWLWMVRSTSSVSHLSMNTIGRPFSSGARTSTASGAA